MSEYKLHDIVLYGSNGVCRIEEVLDREQGRYYVLVPVNKARTRLMVPVDNAELVSRMRSVPDKRSLMKDLERALKDEPEWISDADTRKSTARAVLDSGDAYDVLMLARSFRSHKQQVTQMGKRTTMSDNTILKNAQAHIRDEFSVVLGIDVDTVDDFIDSKAEKHC